MRDSRYDVSDSCRAASRDSPAAPRICNVRKWRKVVRTLKPSARRAGNRSLIDRRYGRSVIIARPDFPRQPGLIRTSRNARRVTGEGHFSLGDGGRRGIDRAAPQSGDYQRRPPVSASPVDPRRFALASRYVPADLGRDPAARTIELYPSRGPRRRATYHARLPPSSLSPPLPLSRRPPPPLAPFR